MDMGKHIKIQGEQLLVAFHSLLNNIKTRSQLDEFTLKMNDNFCGATRERLSEIKEKEDMKKVQLMVDGAIELLKSARKEVRLPTNFAGFFDKEKIRFINEIKSLWDKQNVSVGVETNTCNIAQTETPKKHKVKGKIHVNQVYLNHFSQDEFIIKGSFDGKFPNDDKAFLFRVDGVGHVYRGAVTNVGSVWDINEKEFEHMTGGQIFTLLGDHKDINPKAG